MIRCNMRCRYVCRSAAWFAGWSSSSFSAAVAHLRYLDHRGQGSYSYCAAGGHGNGNYGNGAAFNDTSMEAKAARPSVWYEADNSYVRMHSCKPKRAAKVASGTHRYARARP